MEHIAKVVQKDPIEVRIKNLKQDDCTILNMIEDLKVSAEYEDRKQNAEEFNKVSRMTISANRYYSHMEVVINTINLKIPLHLDGFVLI